MSEQEKEPTSNVIVLFIIIVIISVVSSVILLLMQLWDLTTALAIPTFVIGIFAYIQGALKPKSGITQETLIKGLRNHARGMFLILVGVFLAASLIVLQNSKNDLDEQAVDLNKQIVELNSNYNNAISTLSVQQESLSTKQSEIASRDAQIKELQVTQVAQSTLIGEFEGIATQQAAEIFSLRGTLEALNPSPPTRLTSPAITPNSFNLNLDSGRPPNEITFCSWDELRPAGIRVIARWLKDNSTRGFYIAVQENMGIRKFSMSGWDYLDPTQEIDFAHPAISSTICRYDAKWLVWFAENAIDPTTSTDISLDFLNNDGSVIEQVSFSVE
jgi:hypothetical protein